MTQMIEKSLGLKLTGDTLDMSVGANVFCRSDGRTSQGFPKFDIQSES